MTSRQLVMVILLLVIAGCDENQQWKKDKQEVEDIATRTWIYLPMGEDLIHAQEICQRDGSISKLCTAIDTKIIDLASSYKSCMGNTSRVCQTILSETNVKLLADSLKTAPQYDLPLHPFYWNLPTTFLEKLGDKKGYRSEMLDNQIDAGREWCIQHFLILQLTGLMIVTVVLSYIAISVNHSTKKRVQEAELRAVEKAKEEDRQQQQREAAERERLERQKTEEQRQAKLKAMQVEQARRQEEMRQAELQAEEAAYQRAEAEKAARQEQLAALAASLQSPKRKHRKKIPEEE